MQFDFVLNIRLQRSQIQIERDILDALSADEAQQRAA